MDSDDEPWTTLVLGDGDTVRHGRDPLHLSLTLCATVDVTPENLTRGCFFGIKDNDCGACAAALPNNHY